MRLGRLERTTPPKPMSEINMTPLIDVMLVLLVIFIITAPLMASSLKLDLPRAEAGESEPSPSVVALAVDADGRLYLDDQPLPEAEAESRIRERARDAVRRDPEAELQLRADSRVPYGRVAELIGWVQAAGLSRIGLVTEPPR